ncbi:hypothetical protein BKA63DRAFT_473561 [Paraphoma chrysanthemicola]|nr:hypothetical protein BKA63DRAFT_473561 [Paraphoma chrysanthemicola]
MPGLKGSVLITGANGGLGSAFVSNFIKSTYGSQYRGLYLVRNPSTATDLNAVLRSAPASHTSEVLPMDLSSLQSIRGLAANINTRVANGTLEPLRAVILNAAFQEAHGGTLKAKTFTTEGYEAHFGVNYLANFLFVLLILRSMDKSHGRIVIVSSTVHDVHDKANSTVGAFDKEEYQTVLTDTEDLAKGIEYTDDGFKAGVRRYGASKTLLVMFMFELQRRLNADPVLSNLSILAVDPGLMGGTKLTRNGLMILKIISQVAYLFQDIIVWLKPNGSLRSPKKSGADLLRGAFDEEELGQHPKAVYLNGSEPKVAGKEARDEEKQRRLWTESLKLAGVEEGDTALKDWN